MRMLLNIPCSPFLLKVLCSRCSAVLDLMQIHYHNDPQSSAHAQSDEARDGNPRSTAGSSW